jgi:hypothetical protein
VLLAVQTRHQTGPRVAVVVVVLVRANFLLLKVSLSLFVWALVVRLFLVMVLTEIIPLSATISSWVVAAVRALVLAKVVDRGLLVVAVSTQPARAVSLLCRRLEIMGEMVGRRLVTTRNEAVAVVVGKLGLGLTASQTSGVLEALDGLQH